MPRPHFAHGEANTGDAESKVHTVRAITFTLIFASLGHFRSITVRALTLTLTFPQWRAGRGAGGRGPPVKMFEGAKKCM